MKVEAELIIDSDSGFPKLKFNIPESIDKKDYDTLNNFLKMCYSASKQNS